MKVIFLDVDGVLNNDGYFERTKNEKQNRIELDDENIKYLKEIIDLTEKHKTLALKLMNN